MRRYLSRLNDIKTPPPQRSADWHREVCATSIRGTHPITEGNVSWLIFKKKLAHFLLYELSFVQ